MLVVPRMYLTEKMSSPMPCGAHILPIKSFAMGSSQNELPTEGLPKPVVAFGFIPRRMTFGDIAAEV